MRAASLVTPFLRRALLAVSALVLAAACASRVGRPPTAVAGPTPLPPLPTADQIAWHERAYYSFVHFNMNTFTAR